MRSDSLYVLLALAVLALVVGPIGIAVFVLGFVHGDSPCVLCWAQRTGMILIALTGLFILRFGPRPRYVGLGILIAAHGLYMAMRHSALHLARDVGQGFSIEILGAHTYTWSAIIFWCGLVLMGVLLLLMREGEGRGAVRDLGALGRTAMVLFLVAVAGNMVQAFAAVGPPPFMGQGDPIRFSFQPRNWVWSLEEWEPAPVSWRGRYAIEKPGVAGLPTDWREGPVAEVEPLPAKRHLRVSVSLNGPVTDLAATPSGDFLVTTEAHGVYVLDGDLAHVRRYTVIDPGFSVDVGVLSGVTAVARGTLLALGHNKSFVLLEEAGGTVDEASNYRFFLEGYGAFRELRRGRFATVRARMNYVMSVGYGREADSFYTVTVPNRRYRRLVISRFARSDMTLSEEYSPGLAPGLGLSGEERSLDEYVVTGMAVYGDRLYAASAAYATLLVFDLVAGELVGAHGLEGVERPTGLALRGNDLYVVDGEGAVLVVERPEAPPDAVSPADPESPPPA
jgi:disulfide bond formation protein DsbB